MRISNNIILLSLAIFLIGCQNCVDYRGTFLTDSDISPIKVNYSTLSDVRALLGQETISLDAPNQIVYLGLKIEKKAFYLPKIIENSGYKITFNNNGIVTGIYKMHLTNPPIKCYKGETMIKEEKMTFWQQLIGNYTKMSERNANQSPTN